MILKNKKLSKSFVTSIGFIVLAFIIGLFYWPNIKLMIVGTEYKNITPPTAVTTIDKNLKQKIILKLENFKQYGEWPIFIDQDNPARGNPFAPKR